MGQSQGTPGTEVTPILYASQLLALKNKVDKSQEARMNTSEQVVLVKVEYDKVKVNVQSFIKDQNMTSHKMSLPKRKKNKKADY